MSAARPRRLTPSARRVVAQAAPGAFAWCASFTPTTAAVTRGKARTSSTCATGITDGIGLTVAMQAMNMLDQLAAVEGMGPVGEIRLMPDPETFTVLPYAPHSAAMTVDMLQARRRAVGGLPALVPQAADRRLRRRRLHRAGRLRV